MTYEETVELYRKQANRAREYRKRSEEFTGRAKSGALQRAQSYAALAFWTMEEIKRCKRMEHTANNSRAQSNAASSDMVSSSATNTRPTAHATNAQPIRNRSAITGSKQSIPATDA